MDEKKIHSIIDEAMAARDRNDRDQQQVTDESIRDTLLDLANYAIMTVLEMDTPDESHATLYAYDKPIYTVEEDK